MAEESKNPGEKKEYTIAGKFADSVLIQVL